MAATGKTPILLYGSTTATNTPSAGNLTNSSDGCEIAINVADKNLFFKDSTNVVNTVPIRQSSSTSNGWLSSTDWNTFNNKQPAGTYVTSVTGTAPVVSSGGTTPAISMAAASGSVNGYLTSTDWNTFNNKVSSQWTISGSNLYYSGNFVGIGGNPSAWASIPAFQMANGSMYGAGTTDVGMVQNAYFNGGWKYITSSIPATLYSQSNGVHAWSYAATGTAGGAVTFTEAFKVSNTGDVTVNTGNLVIGTSGKGIDFSATAGTGTSELLADYEEGTWTPNQGSGLTVVGAFSSSGTYTKIGRTVFITGIVSGSTTVAVASAGVITSNLPYTAAANSSGSLVNSTNTAFANIRVSSTSLISAGAIAAIASITFSATYSV